MTDLVAIIYPSESEAEAMRDKLFGLQKKYVIDIGDAVVASKTADGKVKLHQLFSTTAAGTASGSFWGLLVGMVFMMPIVGVALGAGAGALSGALTDFGINDNFMKQLTEGVGPGKAVLFVLIKKMTDDKVMDALRGSGGTILQTSLDHTKEAALSIAMASNAAPTTAPQPTVAS